LQKQNHHRINSKLHTASLRKFFRFVDVKVLCAFFLLVVFVLPYTVKSVHTHTSDNSCHSNHIPTLSNIQNECQICNFEFVSFVTNHAQPLSIHQQTYPVNFCFAITKVYKTLIVFFSLRSPPLA